MEKILYLETKNFESYIHYINKKEEIYSTELFIKHMANRYLFDIDSYKKNVKKYLNISNNVPIYYSSNILLFKIRENDTLYYINYSSLLGIEKTSDYTRLLFVGGSHIDLHINHNRLILALQKSTNVKEYIDCLDCSLS